MDWSGCELVEMVQGKHSGEVLVKGTRIPANAVVSTFEAASPLEEVAEQYPLVSMETLRGVVAYALDRLAWNEKTLVDWSGSKVVERVPGRCSGALTIVRTRIFPDAIAKYYWAGARTEDILEDFPTLSKETVSELLAYLRMHEASAA